MGKTISRLRCPCFGREEKDIETDCITPTTTQSDIEHETSNLDYTTDDMFDIRKLKHSTLDDHELGVRIRYYVLMNDKRIDMIQNMKLFVCIIYIMSKPSNQELYDKVKKGIYAKCPVHSAYRSSLLVQEYKRRGGTYVGSKNSNKGLNSWYREIWSNSRGEVGYKYKNDVHRPTVKVNNNTPKTFKELTDKEIKEARIEQSKTGRVKTFDK